MKIAGIIALAVLSLALIVCWQMDRSAYAGELLKAQAALERANNDRDRLRTLNESNADRDITDRGDLSTAKVRLAQLSKDSDDWLQHFKDEQQTTRDLREKLATLQSNYDSVLKNCKWNYNQAAKWNEMADLRQQQLNDLWAYTKRLDADDAAAQQALGQALYNAANTPAPKPRSYTITGDGTTFFATPDNQ